MNSEPEHPSDKDLHRVPPLDVRFFFDCCSLDDRQRKRARLDAVPWRIHLSQPRCAKRHGRGGWADSDGDPSGAPAFSPGFERLFDPDPNPRQADADDPSLWRWPARAAITMVWRWPPRDGYPDFDLTLQTLRRCGDVDQAAAILRKQFPAMGDPERDRAHFGRALHLFHRVYRPERKRPAPSAETAA